MQKNNFLNRLNNKNWLIWVTRFLLTHNLLISILIRSQSSNSLEVGILVIFSIWLIWYQKFFFAMILMLIGFYLHLLGYYMI